MSITRKILGHYQITSQIGKGGMGEVYRARDTKLGREVAIKVLPEEFARDAERMARFQREAKLLAALDHTNIASIYGLEDSGSTHALVMQLAEGPTLADRIRQGPIPLEEAIPIARQIADALEYAHEHGIIHRDLKPENIKVRDDGIVKVLDFGLAKAFDPATPSSSSAGPMNSPTMTSPATGLGVILGTAGYMSPEQARGRPVGRGADIWAFGVVLFEMLIGQRLFSGETLSDTLAAVLREDLPWDLLPGTTPPAMRRLLRRCLERDPAKRLHDIGDARLELDDPITDQVAVAEPAEATAPGPSRRLERVLWLGALLAAVAVTWWLRPSTGDGDAWRQFTQLTDAAGVEDFPVIAPNGEAVAYVSAAVGSSNIYVQRIGGRNATVVAGNPTLDETSPAFSPDSQRVAYNLAAGAGGIFIAGATGESARRLTDEGFHPAWSPDGRRIAYCTEQIVTPYGRNRISSLWVIPVDEPGARPTKLTDGDAVQPAWSPSGERIAFWSVDRGQRDLYTIRASGGERVPVLLDPPLDWSATWSPDGRYLYFASDRGGSMNLWRIAIDEQTGQRRGNPEPVTMGVQARASLPSFSADGRRLVFRSLLDSVNPVAIPFDPTTGAVGEPAFLFRQTGIRTPTSVSPDGRWLTYQNVGERPEDLFISRVDGSDIKRLTDDEARDRWPTWSPDGKEILFYSNREGGNYALWTIHPDGGGLVRFSDPSVGVGLAYGAFAPDGSRVFSAGMSGGTVFAFDPSVPRPAKATTLARVGGGYYWPTNISPDGRTLVGMFDRGDKFTLATYDIDAQLLNVIESISTKYGGTWLADGRRILFTSEPHSLGLLTVDTGSVQELGPWPFEIASDAPFVSPDGRTIYVGGREQAADVWMVERGR